jgi:hypothetical protein
MNVIIISISVVIVIIANIIKYTESNIIIIILIINRIFL